MDAEGRRHREGRAAVDAKHLSVLPMQTTAFLFDLEEMAATVNMRR